MKGAGSNRARATKKIKRLGTGNGEVDLVLGFELADHSLGLVVEGGDDLVGVLFRVVKSQAADREIDDFMTVPRSRPG